ncbi:NAD(P)/FAD-dependent oxidoreductase [Arhodomonas sp. AD133]|uniref:NAD(P)/FAD-dependent oxidoreductase n=1 Tax=Arhodomonas sp. AD133 TaxID=3415009 RepID=UPI003EBEB327
MNGVDTRQPSPLTATPQRFDIAILGSRLAGTMLAAILARHGLRVVIADHEGQPRYATGEASIPYTSLIFELIADRYGVPEIRNIARARDVFGTIAPTSGVKKNLGFLYHRDGESHDPREALQFNVPSEHGETHLFRQDIDAYMLRTAVRYGAVLRSRRADGDIDIGSEGVSVEGAHGETIRANYVVDVSGRDSPVANRFGLRQEAEGMETRSTTLATHAIGVKRFDDCVPHKLPGRWHEGTLHHVFADGWLGVVPFGNHGGSLNPLCSVTLNLRGEIDGADTGDAQLERLLRRFPSLRDQLGDMRRVREWDVQRPAQYRAIDTVGSRYCLLDEAAAGNDLLFSRKLSNTAELVHAVAHRLLTAAPRGAYDSPELLAFDRVQTAIAGLSDRIAASAYTAFRDFELWNAYARVWLLVSIASTITTKKVYDRFVQTGDAGVFEAVDGVAEDGFWMPVFDGYKELLNGAVTACRDVDAGTCTPSAAARRIFDALADADYVPPIYGFADPEDRVYHLSAAKKLKTLWWGMRAAPKGARRLVFYRSFRKKSSGTNGAATAGD